jgi:hypothetical protein
VMAKCTADRYAYQDKALAAGRAVEGVDPRSVTAYQCKQCRYPDRRKAWHWERRP